jgi:MFS family permease
MKLGMFYYMESVMGNRDKQLTFMFLMVRCLYHGTASIHPYKYLLEVNTDLNDQAYCCAAYFFNYLDRQSFANAYVAGLREDLSLKGNEYSILLSLFVAGSVVGAIPHSLIIQKVRPGIWLPFTLIVWSCITMCSAACKTYTQLAVVRFFQGMMEASVYGGTIYVMGSWYKPSEIATRTAIFTAVGQVGSMCAGLMMTAMHKTMEGKSGLKGWQWVFLIDGLMGIPIGLFGFVSQPYLLYMLEADLYSSHSPTSPNLQQSATSVLRRGNSPFHACPPRKQTHTISTRAAWPNVS